MSKLSFTEIAWSEYLSWQAQDKKTLKRINELLRDVQRSPFTGIGKPEPLKKSPFWSRRIDGTNRFVYEVLDGEILIVQCKGHYEE